METNSLNQNIAPKITKKKKKKKENRIEPPNRNKQIRNGAEGGRNVSKGLVIPRRVVDRSQSLSFVAYHLFLILMPRQA